MNYELKHDMKPMDTITLDFRREGKGPLGKKTRKEKISDKN